MQQVVFSRDVTVNDEMSSGDSTLATLELNYSTLFTGRKVLDATTTPASTKRWAGRLQLSGGTKVVDLAALPLPGGVTLDMTALKLQLIAIAPATANTNTVTVQANDTEGCACYGSSGLAVVPAGGENRHYWAGSGPTIVNNTSDKIKVTSSDTDAIFDIVLAAG